MREEQSIQAGDNAVLMIALPRMVEIPGAAGA